MNNSLRLRLSLWIAGFIAAAGLLAGLLSFALALADAHELQDDQLRQIAALASAGRISPGAGGGANADGEAENRLVIQPLPGPPGPMGPLSPTLAEGLYTIDHGGERWRVAVHVLPTGQRVAAGQPTAVRDEIAGNSALRTIVPLLVLLPALILLVTLMVRAMLQPVARLSVQLDRRQAGDTSPLEAGAVPAEIVPFVASINGLLERVRLLIAQQQRFIADAAHELRTPVTALWLQAENLERAELAPQARERLAPLKEGLARTRALLEQLLSLASQQAGAAAPVPVALDAVLRQAVQDLLPLARARQVEIVALALQPATLLATEVQLAALVRNAIDNAVRYGPAGGTVEVSVTTADGQGVLTVRDEGPGLADEEIERVFDPFYRVDGAPEGGSGLGLAIIRTVAIRLGGTVTLANRPGGGLELRYRQPLAPSS